MSQAAAESDCPGALFSALSCDFIHSQLFSLNCFTQGNGAGEDSKQWNRHKYGEDEEERWTETPMCTEREITARERPVTRKGRKAGRRRRRGE